MIDKIVKEQIKFANKGKEYWKDLWKRLNLQNNDLVIFLCEETKINEYILKYLPQTIKNSKISKVYLIYDENFDKGFIDKGFIDKQINSMFFIELSKEEMICIESLYRIYQFTDQLLITNFLMKSFGDIRNLENKKNITLEDIVSIGFFKNREFKKV